MPGEISLFRFNDKAVRVVDRNGDPWFVAVDACATWGLTNSRQAVSRLDADEKSTVTISDGGRIRDDIVIISEAGLYALISRSIKPEAKAFWKWVRTIVLPSIRKTGRYEAEQTEDGELVRYAREIERQRREMDLIRDTQLKMQADTIRVLQIALEAKREITLQDTFFHLVPWAETRGIHLTKSEEGPEGKRCTAISRSLGFDPEKRPTSQYPSGVNRYKEDPVLFAWEEDYRRRQFLKIPDHA